MAPGVVVSVSGHMAHIAFPDLPGRVPLETIERRWPHLLPALVDQLAFERDPDGRHRVTLEKRLDTRPALRLIE